MNTGSPPNRPRTVTITLWGVFFLGMWNVARAFALGRQSTLLLTLGAKPDPRLRLVMALIWAILFLGIAFGLWRKRPLARKVIPLVIGLYALYELGLLLLFVQIPLTGQAWLLSMMPYLLAILFTGWGLNRTSVKSYFEEGRD